MAWEDVDEHCPNCGAVTKKAIGFNRQNIRYFFWHKPTSQEWTVLFLLLCCVGLALVYVQDTKICYEFMNNQTISLNQNPNTFYNLTLPNYNLTYVIPQT